MNYSYLFNGVLPASLSKEEQTAYFIQSSKGDNYSRNILIEHNMRLVLFVLYNRFSSCSIDTSELVSVGMEALIKAVDCFDFNKGIEFSTFAKKCIENKINKYITDNKKHESVLSLYNIIYDNEKNDEIELINTLSTNENIEEDYLKNNLFYYLHVFIDRLSEKEKEVIIKKYGLNNTKLMSTNQIALDLKISRSYVMILEKKSLAKLKKWILEETLFDAQIESGLSDERNIEISKSLNDKIKSLIEPLDEITKKIIDLYYNLNNEGFYSVNDIANKLNLKSHQVRKIIKDISCKRFNKNTLEILENYRKNLKKNAYSKEFYSYFEGYNKDEILNCFDKLNIEEQKFLRERYGYNLNNINYSLILSKNDINRSNKIINKLKKMLLKIQNEKHLNLVKN